MPAVNDFQWARQRRAAVKAAGGILDPMMPLRVGGDGYPLFCAHPVVGLSWCYTGLFRHVGTDHPIYGLQSLGLRRPEPLPATMDEMVRDFTDRIRRIQPDGPYHLLGWSLGGLIAFAIAEELERRGHDVALLAILDSFPNEPSLLGTPPSPWLLYDFVLADFGYEPALTAEDADPEGKMLDLIRDRPGLGLDDWSDERVMALLRVIGNNVAVSRQRQLGRVRGDLLLFAATRSEPDREEKVARWRPHVDGAIDVVDIDCLHQHLLLPGPAARIGVELTARMAADRPLRVASP